MAAHLRDSGRSGIGGRVLSSLGALGQVGAVALETAQRIGRSTLAGRGSIAISAMPAADLAMLGELAHLAHQQRVKFSG
ncbi:hypothetical protein ACQR1W_01855 [Bradyrhizobium sp. HKCCYLS1011]|uniref:hypothetical protein n=1 Tax=Bradyrhizobium sp. HKCCYLS1011 TaxID=3420733 RepID=UPI003EC09552